MRKHKVYANQQLVDSYEYRHFGGSGGRRVFQVDCATLESLVGDPCGRILDIPCGTGVYTLSFMDTGYDIVAADASRQMLEKTGQKRGGIPRVLCDVNRLPFYAGAFDAVMTVRLFQHLPGDAVTRILRELKRVTGSGGIVVFDTFRWSPRRMRVLKRFFRGEMYVYPHRVVEKMIEQAGLRKVEERSLYLFSPLLYRKIPSWLLRGLQAVEKALPQRWLLRTFWACTES